LPRSGIPPDRGHFPMQVFSELPVEAYGRRTLVVGITSGRPSAATRP